MSKCIGSRVWRLGIAVILMFTLFSLAVSAQEPDTEGAGSVEVGAATRVTLDWTVQPPALTDEQKAQLEYWAAHMNRPGPAPAGQPAAIASDAAQTTSPSAAEADRQSTISIGTPVSSETCRAAALALCIVPESPADR